ncbi:response regulator [Lichenihabitans sp. Uapishka_5]|uniref:response regulator transcription factor n=1 Tax=Lichenihabitans sp. Uapishka_5 TaxID=3037302 RepID=UPI0029E823F7|nr:response regulator [Lichenihabitans sp. Uapishka_5]MDX7951858.1 response regulator [Lichenihabitans sp. Uapishka_5]
MTAPVRRGETIGITDEPGPASGQFPLGTVHIVDDDEVLRTALVRLCRSAGLHAIGHATASEFLDGQAVGRPACILLDVRLGEQNGLAVQDAFREAGGTVPVVFLTGYGTIPMTVRAMRNGATEFLTKPVEDDVLLNALRRALAADLRASEDERAHAELGQRLASLTPRERDVLGCAIGGLMNKQIAAELGITQITAKVHKRHVMEKMSARSLPDLVRIAGRLGIEATRRR